ncbi:MAG: hypothetical protein K1X88_13435 [Nannocystaceae bacterium]|nr:hypothetical protein [Nannocystaceae bacterium]
MLPLPWLVALALLGPPRPETAPAVAEPGGASDDPTGASSGGAAESVRHGIEIRWRAPSGCPGEPELRTRLAELLGADARTQGVRIDGTVTTAPGGFALSLRTQTDSGTSEHRLSSPDCHALADGAALIAAVAADPLAVDRSLAAPPPEVEPPPPDEVVVTVSPPPRDPPRRRGRLRLARFALRADGVLAANVLPKLGFGPIVSAGMIGPYWRAELSAIYLAPRPAFVDATKTQGASIDAWTVRGRGCGVPVWRVLEFPLCLGLEGGQMSARPLGQSGQTGRDARGFGLFSVGGAIGVSPRPFVAFFAGVDAIVALARPRFVVDAVQVHRPKPAGVRATVGLELRVP